MMTGFRAVIRVQLLGLIGVSMALSGCGALEFSNRPFSGNRHAIWLEKATSGSRFEEFLVWSDRREVEKSAWSAAGSDLPHAEVSWSNPATGSSGSVRSGVVYLVGFNAGAELEAPVRLDSSVLLSPVAGDYVTNANANVRLSPEVNGEKVTLLRRGNRVKVIAHEPAQGWYLVTSEKRVIGYVFADLLDKADGGDLLLVGGDIQYPRLCRELTYKMRFSSGKSDEWLNGVCREGDQRWSVVGGRALEAVE